MLNQNTTYLSIWGTSSNNLYLGSANGNIIHWDGTKATVSYSGNISITDIYGISDNIIYAVGNKSIFPSVAVYYNGSSWQPIEGLDVQNTFYRTIFLLNEKEKYIGGPYTYKYLNGQWLYEKEGDNVYKIRGNKNTKEIWGVGPGNTIVHFNGNSWYNFKNEITQEYLDLYGIQAVDNKVFIAGLGIYKAKILIGTKN